MATRKEKEAFIIKYIKKLTNSPTNVKLYEDRFKSMSDKEFDIFIKELGEGTRILEIIVPVDVRDNDCDITIENNFKLAEELGYKFEQSLLERKDENSPLTETNEKYLILDLPVRRTKQTLVKGITVSSNNKKIDELTGQVKDDSASTKITQPEIQLLLMYGLEDSVIELLKERGGDKNANKALNDLLRNKGTTNRQEVELYEGGVVATQSLANYFYGMHVDNTVIK